MLAHNARAAQRHELGCQVTGEANIDGVTLFWSRGTTACPLKKISSSYEPSLRSRYRGTPAASPHPAPAAAALGNHASHPQSVRFSAGPELVS